MPAHEPDGACALPPALDALERLLDAYAPLVPAPLCPELAAYHALSLVDFWKAAEDLAGGELAAPFWAYPWPAGCALARVILDHPELVLGRRVLDVGCGGGVSALAAARAGAALVVANDIDAWALATARLAGSHQGLHLRTVQADLTADRDAACGYDVVLCGDLAYERSQASPQRDLLLHARDAGARVLVADAERTYFRPDGLRLLAEFTVGVPRDLEGVDSRTARVYEME